MAQFDLFANPIPSARGAYPFVVVLQSDLADGGRDSIVAPLAPRAALAPVAGRLTPIVSLDDTEYVVLVPGLAGVRQRDLRERVGTLEAAREPLLAAVDYLFFGV